MHSTRRFGHGRPLRGVPSQPVPAAGNRFALLFEIIGVILPALLLGCGGTHSNINDCALRRCLLTSPYLLNNAVKRKIKKIFQEYSSPSRLSGVSVARLQNMWAAMGFAEDTPSSRRVRKRILMSGAIF